MRKFVFVALMVALTPVCLAQSNGMFVTLRVTDSIWLNSKWIKGFSDDSTLGIGSAGIIPTQKAIKGAFQNTVQSINGLSNTEQLMTVGNAGADFNISSAGNTHTFNLPAASATNSGKVTTGAQQFAGSKEFLNGLTVDNMPAQGEVASLFVTSNDGVLNTRTADQVRGDILAAPASGGTSYIWNQNSAAQSGSLWISGKVTTADTVKAKAFHMAGTSNNQLYVSEQGSGPSKWAAFTGTTMVFSPTGGTAPLTINGTGITQGVGMLANLGIVGSTSLTTNMITVNLSHITASLDLNGSPTTTVINEATTGNPLITLPTISGTNGRVINIVNAPANASNYCTWTPAARLDAATTVSSFDDAALGGTTHITLQWGGTEWWVIAH